MLCFAYIIILIIMVSFYKVVLLERQNSHILMKINGPLDSPAQSVALLASDLQDTSSV